MSAKYINIDNYRLNSAKFRQNTTLLRSKKALKALTNATEVQCFQNIKHQYFKTGQKCQLFLKAIESCHNKSLHQRYETMDDCQQIETE